MDPSTFLSLKLVDKEVITPSTKQRLESYRYAQNAILIHALLKWDCPPGGLLKLSDTLVVTPGQKHVGEQLNFGKYGVRYLVLLLAHAFVYVCECVCVNVCVCLCVCVCMYVC